MWAVRIATPLVALFLARLASDNWSGGNYFLFCFDIGLIAINLRNSYEMWFNVRLRIRS